MRLNGKAALVTGAASGMGAATAALFGREGARVALLDRDQQALRTVAGEISGSVPLLADIGDSAAVTAAFTEAVRQLGQLDIVVHAAGIDNRKTKDEIAASDGKPLDITAEMSDEQWHDHLRVNLDGAFYVVRAALRVMLPRGSGSIITIASIGGITGCFMPNYSAAKGGVLAFTRAVA